MRARRSSSCATSPTSRCAARSNSSSTAAKPGTRWHWLFFANRGECRVGDYEEVMNKASCLGLLSNAAVLWNTVHVKRMVGRLQAAGTEIDPADLAHIWPLQHARIIPNGTYFLNWPQGEMAKAP